MKLPIQMGLMVACVFTACHSGEKEAASRSKKETLSTATVARRDIETFIEATGDLSPANLVTIKAEVSGRLKKLHVGTGQPVQEGDLLVSLDDTDLRTEKATVLTTIDGANLRLEKTQRAFDRSRELFERKSLSKELFDNAQTELELAKNEADRAQKALQAVEDKLKKILIRAPLAGTVLEVSPAEGEVVVGASGFSAGTKIMDIADLSGMRVQAFVNQVDVMQLHPNQPANIIVEAAEPIHLQGEITFISPIATAKVADAGSAAAASSKGFKINVRIVNPDPRARPGVAARVRVKTAEAKNALSAPLTAIFSEEEKKFVYVKIAAATEKRQVKVGLSDLDNAEILSGVKEGEILLLEKPAKEKPAKGKSEG